MLVGSRRRCCARTFPRGPWRSARSSFREEPHQVSEATLSRDVQTFRPPRSRNVTSMFQSLELDTRLVGMIIALLIIWFGFQILSGGLFLTPRNLWNLSVQSASIAIMATGMVLVIVSRNIDLSVGSVLGFL